MVPVIVNELGPAVVFTQTLPKEASAVAVNVGEATPQTLNVDAVFLGFGAPVAKSVEFSFASVQRRGDQT